MLMIQGACYPRVTPVIIKFSHSLALFPEHSLLSGGLLRMDLVIILPPHSLLLI